MTTKMMEKYQKERAAFQKKQDEKRKKLLKMCSEALHLPPDADQKDGETKKKDTSMDEEYQKLQGTLASWGDGLASPVEQKEEEGEETAPGIHHSSSSDKCSTQQQQPSLKRKSEAEDQEHHTEQPTQDLSIRPFKQAKEQESTFHGPKQLPQPPFRMLVAAQSFSGKTTMLMNMLMRPEFGYRKYFGARVFIFSNSLITDPIWKELPEEWRKRAHHTWNEERFKSICDGQTKLLKEEGGVKTSKNAICIVIDDSIDMIAHTQGVKSIDAMYMRGRHSNISIVITTQEYMKIPKTLRVNRSHFIVFHITNAREKKQIADEQNGGLSTKSFLTVCEEVWKTPYAFLYVNFTEPDMTRRFFNTFNTQINVSGTEN